MGGRRNEKKEKKREEEGIQGERKKKIKRIKKQTNKQTKKNLLLALNRSGYFCWCPVCATGGGVWRDWFHFSLFLGHTLRCFVSVVPGSQSVR